jgi:GalNAc-alpha-(1->4)-GalNAc-alpha-(1->3)-diNAcBac-PP-undecaprenol alpha-1,4-N-acetyl-D-galactosaminyltransferase
MKILFTCWRLTGGGAERVCVDVANGLLQLGHETAILADFTQPVTYHPLPGVKRIQTAPYSNAVTWRISALRQMVDVMRSFRPDAVVCILYNRATAARIASMLTVKCPVVASDHNAFERPPYAPMRRRQHFDKFTVNRWLDALTVLTRADARVIGNRLRHVYVMPNPLGIVPADAVPPKERIVLAVGRLDEWHCKGFDLLVEAWKDIAPLCRGWKLRIVGHGSDASLAKLKDMGRGVRDVEFLPYTENIRDEYRRAAVFVLSSRYEGFGLVLTEAMSQGCACVACDFRGRQSEIVTDGTDGLIVPIDDAHALAMAMKHLIVDTPAREALQRQAIKGVARFAPDVIARRWERMLMEVTARKRGSKNQDKTSEKTNDKTSLS